MNLLEKIEQIENEARSFEMIFDSPNSSDNDMVIDHKKQKPIIIEKSEIDNKKHH